MAVATLGGLGLRVLSTDLPSRRVRDGASAVAFSEATHGTVTPTAISISWGQNEDAWTAQARHTVDQAFVDAATLGVAVTADAGDNGSTDGASDERNLADFAASSPHVLSCGGVSAAFAIPDWQTSAGVPSGLLQPHLYGPVSAAPNQGGLRDITAGNKGSCAAKPGWDACTGLGVPDGTTLLALLLISVH